MAEVAHLFTCDRAYEDDLGRPSMLGVFDHLWSTDFPFTQPRLVVAAQMVGHHDESCDLVVELLDPQHHVIVSAQSESPVSLSDIGQGFLSLTLQDTVFELPGRYTVRVLSQGRVAASKPLVVQHETGSGSTSQLPH